MVPAQAHNLMTKVRFLPPQPIQDEAEMWSATGVGLLVARQPEMRRAYAAYLLFNYLSPSCPGVKDCG